MTPWSKLPTVPVWVLSGIAIVVILVGGMAVSYFDPSASVDALDRAEYPDGAQVSVEGASLTVHVGRKEMGPGWFGLGSWRYDVTFPDGKVLADQGPLVIVDKGDLVVRCDASTHTCAVEPGPRGAPARAP